MYGEHKYAAVKKPAVCDSSVDGPCVPNAHTGRTCTYCGKAILPSEYDAEGCKSLDHVWEPAETHEGRRYEYCVWCNTER